MIRSLCEKFGLIILGPPSVGTEMNGFDSPSLSAREKRFPVQRRPCGLRQSIFFIFLSFALPACFGSGTSNNGAPLGEVSTDVSSVSVSPASAVLKRLSDAQYRNTIRDLLGPEIVVPSQLEPDAKLDGLVSLGSSVGTISSVGAERFENAAFKIAEQALADPDVRARVLPCEPSSSEDTSCFRTILSDFGKRAWRRPLEADELDRLAAVVASAATTYQSATTALEFGLGALLQSPNFLYRIELGEADPDRPGQLRYTAYEMASRLSYFLTNTMPDDELLAAAESGSLATVAGIEEQAVRLLQSGNAKEAVDNFFSELYDLTDLDNLSKDPLQFKAMDKELGPAARKETLMDIERIVFTENGDFRTLFTSRQTFVDRRLAAIYGIRAPSPDGFSAVTFPVESGRRGFLGQVSFLAKQSHPGSTSAVLRGRFVRETLLCGEIPPPIAAVNTGLEAPSEVARTLRERSLQHQRDPVCAGCHSRMDPIGYGFENFDAIGTWRDLDNGGVIDPSGDLDGTPFEDAASLGEVIAESPDMPLCLVRNLYRYATGNKETPGEFGQIEALNQTFVESGYRVLELFKQVAKSSGFRLVAAEEGS